MVLRCLCILQQVEDEFSAVFLQLYAFSALMLLVGQQKGIWPVKNLSVWVLP